MHKPKMNYFTDQDIIHIAIRDEEEFESLELSPHRYTQACSSPSFRIWTPPVMQAFIYFWIGVRLHTYIRPLI